MLSEELQRALTAKEEAYERWKAAGSAVEEMETALAQAPSIALETLLLPGSLPTAEDTKQYYAPRVLRLLLSRSEATVHQLQSQLSALSHASPIQIPERLQQLEEAVASNPRLKPFQAY